MIQLKSSIVVSSLRLCILMGLATHIDVSSGAISRHPHSIHKRNLFQLCELVSRHTNRGCLEYNYYGCFCGWGNAASHHVDATDACCRMHDDCYGRVSCWFYPQLVTYSFLCSGDTCSCTGMIGKS
ncbi:phospholipase A2 [Elysia marginata]|uniref:Phosphatidylcholine 2-acylhydrolase n=1 Tax=Elysia marginata TaxID=1093978 RepID=A0AAV4GDJ3_9GAST|nr:phospholipase A2 [Elysia marginata]